MGICKASDVAVYPLIGRARFAQAVLACVGLFTAMDSGVVALLIEPMKIELKLNDVQLGLANMTTFYVAYGVLCTPMGILADRVSRVRLLSVAIALWCGGLALAGLSPVLWVLVVSKMLLGAGSAMTYPASMSLLSDFFTPARRSFATATYSVGQNLGSAGAVLLGGLGYSALVRFSAGHTGHLGGLAPWRVVFLVFATLGLLLLPLLFVLREPARQEVVRKGGGSLRELWTFRRFLIPLFGGMMCLSGATSGVGSWVAPALMRQYGLQPGDFAGWFSGIGLATGVAGALIGSRLVDLARKRGGRDAVILPAAVAALFCAPACFVAVAPGVLWFQVTWTAFTLFAVIAIVIPVIAINFRVPNELRGLTMGLYVVLIALTNAVVSPLIAVVGGLIGGPLRLGLAMGAVSAPLALLGALGFWVAARSRSGKDIPAVAADGATP